MIGASGDHLDDCGGVATEQPAGEGAGPPEARELPRLLVARDSRRRCRGDRFAGCGSAATKARLTTLDALTLPGTSHDRADQADWYRCHAC